MKLEIFVGPPGCGKSTKSKLYVDSGYTYINQDSQGRDNIRIFNEALKRRENIVVDRMNFSKEQRAKYIVPARDAGYEISSTEFYVPRSVCINRCAQRKDHDTIHDVEIAKKVINFFFSKYERVTEDEVDDIKFDRYNEHYEKPAAIICDLDGTLCNIDHRLNYVKRAEGQRKDWNGFFRAMAHDTPNEWCSEILYSMSHAYEIVYASGRSEEYRDLIERWLKDHGLDFGGPLFLRPSGDFRKDDIIKECILDFDILTQYDPLFAIDDRKQIVNMWRRRGLICLQCADGNF